MGGQAGSDAENIRYIMARTKQCPKCKAHIEKDKGCNHMTCKKCKHQFCWLCKGDWKDHGVGTGGFYKCKIHEDMQSRGQKTNEEKEQRTAQNDLDRYILHYSRFDNHMNNIKLAERTKLELERRMSISAHKWEWGTTETGYDATFLWDAVDTVIECRRLLAWTYPVGFYIMT